MQQHHISRDEAIKVAELHFGGKAYAWWIFVSFSLKNENTSSYARFINTLVERFDGKLCTTHMVNLNKHEQTKTLHVMEETINSASLQKIDRKSVV